MVRKYNESTEKFESILSDNLHRIDYIAEWVEIMCNLKDDELESAGLAAAIKKVYDALGDFEDVYSKITTTRNKQ